MLHLLDAPNTTQVGREPNITQVGPNITKVGREPNNVSQVDAEFLSKGSPIEIHAAGIWALPL